MADDSFDTLAAVQRLKGAGIYKTHAEAIAETLAKAVRSDRNELITKAEFWKGISGVLIAILMAILTITLGNITLS